MPLTAGSDEGCPGNPHFATPLFVLYPVLSIVLPTDANHNCLSIR
jgi:hypothetical protein